MTDQYDIEAPDRFTVGAVGEVGSRLFLIQCQKGVDQLTLKVEKTQVAALAKYLAGIVREIGRPGSLPEDLDLDEQADPEWVVGTIGVSYDKDAEQVVVVVQELVPEDEEGSAARISISLEQAAAFAIRATNAVEAGRPPCPLCGLPLDPAGHDCPRTNGHRPPIT